MPCYRPLQAYRARKLNESGKRGLVFSKKLGYADLPVEVPCGQCIGCRLERSRQWAMRCMHEASLYDHNCFLTLTYNDDHLPDDHSVNVQHFQDFIRSLRKRNQGKTIRYYHCGEYGDKTLRPHYHAILFNHDFPDKVEWSNAQGGHKQYISEKLNETWGRGLATIGSVTFESAAYVARYVMKKVNGEQAETHYNRCDPETGESWTVRPEYTTMSRRPGIGKGWYDKFKTDCYPSDFLVVNNHKVRPPKYYDNQYPDIERIKAKRQHDAKKYSENNTSERLRVREKVAESRLNQLKRNLE